MSNGLDARFCSRCGKTLAIIGESLAADTRKTDSTPAADRKVIQPSIRKVMAFQYGMSPVLVPSLCPRCNSTMLDYNFDATQNAAVTEWYSFKMSETGWDCGALVLTILTLGIWLPIFGLWSLILIPTRSSQKRRALENAWSCVRSSCRSCGLAFYPGELEGQSSSLSTSMSKLG